MCWPAWKRRGASVGAGEGEPVGTLRIAAPASFGRMHLMPALVGVLERYPGLNLDLRLSDTLTDLVEGGFDIAIRNAQLNDSSMVARKLANDSRVLCASPAYIKQHSAPGSPQQLNDHQCITLTGLENWRFDGPEGPVNIRVTGRLRADNGEAVRDAAVSGLGITIASRWNIYRHLQEGTLVELMPEYPLHSDTAIWAVYPSSRLLAPKVRAFIDYCTEYFGETPYWESVS